MYKGQDLSHLKSKKIFRIKVHGKTCKLCDMNSYNIISL